MSELIPQTEYMMTAIEVARKGILCGQSPFGSVIVRGAEILMAAHNQVWATSDPTAHAEVTCIRMCCQQNHTIELSGAVLYSTCEPCPMCFAACHWAKLDAVIFGASILDAHSSGFSELSISNHEMAVQGGSSMKIISGFMVKECVALFKEWASRSGARSY